MSQPRRNRKGPKRKQPTREQLDDDLADLISLIDEHRNDQGVRGWLSIPWRDGWNAAEVALEIARVPHEYLDRLHDVQRILVGNQRDMIAYEKLEETMRLIRASGMWELQAAIRIMQVVIARSDGGGAVPNVILERVISAEHETVMRHHRMRDALNIRSRAFGLGTPEAVRLTKAFHTAWSRGLYRVAYALPQFP